MQCFDLQWKFLRGDFSPDTDITNWETVDLPHDFAISMPFRGQSDYPFPGTVPADWEGTRSGGTLARGKGCYAKDFSVDVPTKHRAFLVFDGVYRNSTVYVNGKQVAHQSNGYMGFEVDITDCLQPQNRVFVRVDNSRNNTSRWYTGSGIYRHVYLDIRPTAHAKNVYITTPEISDTAATVHITGELTAPASGKVEILSPKGDTVANTAFDGTLDVTLTVNAPIRWDTETPALYTARITVAGKAYDHRFGIRTVEFVPGEGMLLNGRRVFMKGFCIHHDLGVSGAAAFDSLIRDRLQFLKDMGLNAIRLSHNPHAPLILDLCDEMGMLVFDECFDNLFDQYVDDFLGTWKDELAAFIRRDRNHPCVMLWSVGNETEQQKDSTPEGAAFIKEMSDFAKTIDPTRKTTCAQYPSRAKAVRWLDADFDKSEPAEMSESTDIHSCNYTWRFFERDIANNPDWMFIQSEAGVGDTDLCGWDTITKLPNVCGQFYWGGIDYLGEAVDEKCRGWWRGFVDLIGQKRALAYQVEAAFQNAPVIHIGVACGRGDMFWNDADLNWQFITDHWNWEDGRDLDVIIYSNTETVKLVLNGVAVDGVKKTEDCFTFRCQMPFKAGTLTAYGYDADDKVVCSHTLHTAGAPAAVTLTASEVIAPARNDAVTVTAQIVDKAGIPCMTCRDEITFTVENGYLAGCGTADLYTDIPYGSPTHPAYDGRAQAVVRSDGSSKPIKVTAVCGDMMQVVVLADTSETKPSP